MRHLREGSCIEWASISERAGFKSLQEGRARQRPGFSRSVGEISAQIRATRHQRDLGFIIIVDGDSLGFQARLAAVKNALRGTQDGDADDSLDRVAILVPSWSIETWLRHFEGASVTETPSLKTEVQASRIGELSSKGADAWDGASAEGLPALLAARQQLDALLGRGR